MRPTAPGPAPFSRASDNDEVGEKLPRALRGSRRSAALGSHAWVLGSHSLVLDKPHCYTNFTVMVEKHVGQL